MTEFLRQCAEKDTLTAEDRKRLIEIADKFEEYHCSHCNRLAPLNAYRKHNMTYDYCHICGAKMDKESEK